MQRMYPRRPDRKRAAGRTILTGDIVNIEDLQTDPEYATTWRSLAVGEASSCRCCASVSRSARSASSGSSPDDSRMPRSNCSGRSLTKRSSPSRMCACSRNWRRNAELTDALARQTATAEVLSVSKRPRHHRGPRNHYPEAPMTPGRRSHRRDGSAAVQRLGLFPAEPFDNAVAVVVQRQRHRHGNGREQDHLEVVARLGPSTLR